MEFSLAVGVAGAGRERPRKSRTTASTNSVVIVHGATIAISARALQTAPLRLASARLFCALHPIVLRRRRASVGLVPSQGLSIPRVAASRAVGDVRSLVAECLWQIPVGVPLEVSHVFERLAWIMVDE